MPNLTQIKDDKSSRFAHSAHENFSSSWKRFQNMTPSHVPTLIVDQEGSVLHLTPRARQLLEYKPDQPVEPYFLSHIHGRNLRQVMRDLADMIKYGKSKASWLVQMRTGQGRWRWYKASAKREQQQGDDPLILVKLRDLYQW